MGKRIAAIVAAVVIGFAAAATAVHSAEAKANGLKANGLKYTVSAKANGL